MGMVAPCLVGTAGNNPTFQQSIPAGTHSINPTIHNMNQQSEYTRKEFLTFVMLYAGSVDINLSIEEEDLIRQKVGEEAFVRVKAQFDEMADSEVLDLIYSYKGKYCSSKEETDQALEMIREVFSADHRFSQMEKAVMEIFRMLMTG
jgi:hypothetical protein